MTETPHHRQTAQTEEAGAQASTLSVLNQAPAPNPERNGPAARRLLQADGANIIAFTFSPGQSMPEHQAAHPIVVQCLQGELTFTVDGETTALQPGVAVHVPARVLHSVHCPDAAEPVNILMLTMLTG